MYNLSFVFHMLTMVAVGSTSHYTSCILLFAIPMSENDGTLSQDGDKFWKMPECYIRGSTIKYLRIPDEIIDMVKEEVQRPRGEGRGRGRGGRGGGGRDM